MSDVGAASANAYTQLSEANYSRINTQVQQLADNPESQKIERSAKQFESILLASWLEQAEKSFATVPGGDGDENSDPGKDQLKSYGVQAVASALTNAGGIGIAAMISKGLEKAAAVHPPVEPANSQKTPVGLRATSGAEKM
jgi:Rod binding domain-containing protein